MLEKAMNARPAEFLERHGGAVLALAIVALTALAWSNRFIQDDAFISFRYAENLARGEGLVWNPGERVEGYTNFLWTLLLAIPFRLGFDPVAFSLGVGLLLFPLSLLATHRLALAATGSAPAALATVVLLGSNYTFSAYATGGLETQLQVCLLLWAAALGLSGGDGGAGRLVAVSLLSAAALLARLDSALFLALLYAFAIAKPGPGRAPARRALLRATLLVLPGALVVAPWLAWKLSYYGDLLPNTYYAKVTGIGDSWRPGLHYLGSFLASYWLAPVFVLPLFFLGEIRRRASLPVVFLATVVLAWWAYAIRVGGDFMEFRLLVPSLPCLFALVAWLLFAVIPHAALRAAAVALVLAGSLHHARTFELDRGIESVSALHAHIVDPDQDWGRVGRLLRELFFDPADPITLATTASGAVPFHAGLETVDQLGLTDAWVARRGLPSDVERSSPGHRRIAPFGYLVERGVNLVVAQPVLGRRRPEQPLRFASSELWRFAIFDADLRTLPSGVRMAVLEIPFRGDLNLYLLYLTPSDSVDAGIRAHGIQVVDIAGPSPTRTDASASGG